jgi:hypothetical protein
MPKKAAFVHTYCLRLESMKSLRRGLMGLEL